MTNSILMKTLLRTFFSLAMLCFVSLAYAQMNHVPGEMIVQFGKNDVNSTVKEFQTFSGLETGMMPGEVLSAHMNIYTVHYDTAFAQERQLLESMRRNHNVLNAQFNHYVSKRDTVIPNDTLFSSQWHHLNTGQTNGNPGSDIGSTLAWDITTGGLTAAGDTIVVCVIEGGNLNHPDLKDNAWVNHNEIPGNGIDDDGNGFVDDYLGWNVANQSDQGVLSGGHGTQVMGMIGAKGNNGLGVSGINWDVKIMSVAGENLFNEASVVAAYNYALVMRKLYDDTDGDRGAFVVATNASWGIDGGNMDDVPIWNAFYDTLGVYGILNCGATANNNVNIDVVGDIPTASSSDYMISVTATNHNDNRTFSAYGLTTIDLAAPGGNVFTTSGGQGYGTTSGTSFASPLTAGVIALLYSVPCNSFIELVKANPQLGADYVRYALMEGVDPVQSLQGFIKTGGRVNAYNSLNILADNCSGDFCLPPFSFNYTLADDTVYTFNWNQAEGESASLRYRPVGSDEWVVVDSLTDGSFTVTSLAVCTTYEFQVASTCSENDGELLFGSTRVLESKGCCVAPEELDKSDISDQGVVLSWENGFLIENYEVYYRVEGDSDWIFSLASADGLANVENLEACTFYELLLKPACIEGFDEAITTSIRTLGCGSCIDNVFCNSRGQFTFLEYLNKVYVDELVFESGDNGGYALFEETGIEFEVGTLHEIALEPGFVVFPRNQFFRVWIDFDQDGDFSNDEIVMESSQGSSATLIDVIEIPDDALIGSTRMRIAMKSIGNEALTVTACEQYFAGETEDYCIQIISTLSASEHTPKNEFTLYPNPGNGELKYRHTPAPEATMQTAMTVHDITGKVIVQKQLNSNEGMIDLRYLQNGIYLYSIANALSGEVLYTGKFIIAK